MFPTVKLETLQFLFLSSIKENIVALESAEAIVNPSSELTRY